MFIVHRLRPRPFVSVTLALIALAPAVFGGAPARAATAVEDDRSRVFSSTITGTGANRVAVDDHPALALGSAFTIELWARRSSGASEQALVEKRNSYALAYREGTLMYQLVSASTGTLGIWLDTGVAMPADTWTHLAFVKDGTTVRLYVDGSLAYTASGTAIADTGVSYGLPATLSTSGYRLRFGADDRGLQPFGGNLSDVRIWGTARSATEVSTLRRIRLASDIGTWFLDESVGAIARNSAQTTGSALDGSYGGTTPPATSTDVPVMATTWSIDDTPALVAYLPGYDPDGAVSFAITTEPTLATIDMPDPATGAITLTPAVDADGADLFAYTVTGPDAQATTPVQVQLQISDRSRPQLTTFTTSSGAYDGGLAQTYALGFSEPVSGIDADDFANAGTATDCAFDPGADTGATRTLTVTGCTEGTLIPNLRADAAADAVGNTGPVGIETGPTITIDRTPPAVTSFTTAVSGATNATSVEFALVFSEDVTGVAGEDFENVGTATSCVFDPGADTGSTRTVTVTGCSDGTLQPRLRDGSVEDGSGTAGPGSAVTVAVALTLDRTAPTSAASFPTVATNDPTLTLSYVAADADVVGKVTAYYSTTLGLLMPMPCGEVSSPATSGSVTCLLPAVHPTDGSISTDGTYYVWTQATDAAGNVEGAPLSADVVVALDRVPPTVTAFSTTSASPTADTTLTYEITFSEPVSGVAPGDFANHGTATGCTFDPGTDTGSSRTVTVTGCSTGTLIPRFAATEARDAAGNLGPSTEVDATPTITLDRASPTLDPIAVAVDEGQTLTFSSSTFQEPFQDDRAVQPASITIRSLPTSGTLLFAGSPVTPNQVLAYADLGNLTYEPEPYVNGTFDFTVTASDGANESDPPTIVSITLRPVTTEPRLTRVDPLAGANEDQSFTITYQALVDASDARAFDATLRFRIESIVAGGVTKDGAAVVVGTTSIGPGEAFVWTPPADAYGLVAAFTVRAFDGTSTSTSPIQVQAQVAAQVCTTADSTANGWNIRMITAVGECTWVVPAGVTTVEALVVGGGGGGGSGVTGTYSTGGGGGAGGVRHSTSVGVSPGSSYRVTVGAGGGVDASGGGSAFGAVSVSGGGYGGQGASVSGASGYAGGSGGSGGGGGAGYSASAGAGGAGTVGQGANGAAGTTNRTPGSGGGALGTNGSRTGRASDFTGTSVTYGTGGLGVGNGTPVGVSASRGDGGPSRTAGGSGVVGIRWATATPTVSPIADQATSSNTSISGISFTVADADTATAQLTVSATSSNTTVVPNANIVIGGTNPNRSLTITPAPGQSGAVTITVAVTDGATTGTTAFELAVGDAVRPTSSVTFPDEFTTSTSLTLSFVAADLSGIANLKAYYATAADLSNGQQCGNLNTSATSGTITCSIPAVQGAYYLYTRATDTVGNVENAPATADAVVVYDTVKPVSVMTTATLETNSTTIADVAVAITDAGRPASGTLYFSTSGSMAAPTACGTWTSSSASVTGLSCTLSGSDGRYYLASRATDAAGNGENAKSTADDSIVLDRVAPVTTASIAATLTGVRSVPVSYTAADANTIATVTAYYSTASNLASPVACGSASSSATSGSVTCTLPATTGTYYVYTRGTDLAGNVEAAPTGADDSIALDVTAPAALTPDLQAASDTGVSNTDDVTRTRTPVIDVAVYETGATVTVSAVRSGATTVTCTATSSSCALPSLSDGTWTITASQTDPAGNVSPAGGTLTITVDNSGPQVTSFAYETGVSGGVRFSLDFDEAVTGLAADDFTAGGTAPGWSVTAVSGSGAGPYLITVSGSARGTVVPVLAADAVENAVELAGPAIAGTPSAATAQEPWLDAPLGFTVLGSGTGAAPVLTADEAAWVGVPGGTVSRQWQTSVDDGATWVDYPSATGVTLTPSSTYNGRVFRLVSTYVNAHGTAVAFSRGRYVRWFGAGLAQTWTVPVGATVISADLVGAKGGEVVTSQLGNETDQAGLGGRVSATLTGLGGQTVQVYVGGQGSAGATSTSPLSARTGGSGGGGNSGGSCSSGSYYGAGGSGGGATDIRLGGTALGNRILVAGGGGGDGINLTAFSGRSGHGGGLVGGDAWDGRATGGTQSAGGTGGYGAGSLGTGGAGYCFGGGGGGGYYGGAGGSVWYNGAGGSSYADPAYATDVVHDQGAALAAGNGLAVFSWDAPLASTGTVSLDPVTGPIAGRATQTFAVSFADSATGLEVGDLAVTGVTGWSVTDVVGYGRGPYMVSVAPGGAASEGQMGLRLTGGSVSVAAAPAPAADLDATSTITIDLTGPIAQTLVSSSQSPTNAASLTYTLTFDGTTTGTAAAEFSNTGTATGCTFAVSGSGAIRTVAVASCSEGTVIPRFVPATSVDPYGNLATPASLDGTEIAIDRTAPVATATPDLDTASDLGQSATDDLTADATPTIVVGGIEDQASVVVSAARAGASTATCSITRATVADGTGSCALPTLSQGTWSITAVQTDYAGTASPASSSIEVAVDTTRPTASWTATPGSLVTGATATYTLTLSEDVYGLEASDLSNASNATGCTFDPGADTGATRTVLVSDCGDGGLVARLAAGGATDTAGNTGPASAAQAPVTTAMRKLYDFTSHTFTPCGASGYAGPTLAACQAAYTTDWDADTTLYGASAGMQSWVVPETGTYELTVNGAAGSGGATTRGGVRMQGRYDLTAGDVLKLAVGQMPGATLASCTSTGGGGGGSFLATGADVPIMVAGGSGGRGRDGYGSAGQTGTAGAAGSGGGAGGTNGGAGANSYGYGGAGFSGSSSTAASFTSGATGAQIASCYGGGFGGGGRGSSIAGGGGGGYSGGGGGGRVISSYYTYYYGGGGGGSFAAAGVSRVAYLSTTSWLSSAGYQADHGSITIAKARALQTITFDPLPDLTYGDPAFEPEATSTSGLPISFRSETTSVCSIAGGVVTLKREGTCTIRAYSLGDDDWYPEELARSFAIAKAPLTITASSHAVDYGDPIPTVAPAYSGLQYGESAAQGLTTQPTCTTAYVTASGAGTTPSTTCAGAASVKYAITYEAGAVTVGRRLVTVAAGSYTVAYGAAAPNVGFTLFNMANGETATALSPQPTCTTTYVQYGLPGEANTTSCSSAGSSNYDFAYVPGTVTTTARTVTVTASNESRTYGDPDIPAPTPTYTGWAPGEGTGLLTSEATCTTTYTPTSTVAAGAATSCSGAAAPNYVFQYTNGRVTVTKRQVTITASDGTTVYGTTAPTITPIYGNEFVNGDTSAVVSGTNCTSAWAVTTPTTTTPRSYCRFATAANYDFAYVDGVVTVTRKPITAIAQTRSITYGSAVPTITVGYSGMVNGDTGASALSPQPTCTTDYLPTDHVGTPRTTTCTGGAGTNYDITAYQDGVITITKRTISVTASSHTVVYGDARPTITPASYTGWVNDESEATVSIAGITCAAAAYQPTTAVTSRPATTCSGGTADDYSFSHVNGAITILKTDLSVTASDHAVEYGDPIPTVTATYAGWVNGEGTGNLATQARCRTAYVPTTAVAASALDRKTECWGVTATNYEMTYVDGTVTVSPAPVEITSSSPTAVYGDVVESVRSAPSVASLPTPATGGVTLVADDGMWTGAAGETATRQWQLSTNGGSTWTDIAGETAATYVPSVSALANGVTAFRVQVTWTDGAASLAAVSEGLLYKRFIYNGSYQGWTAPNGVTSARFDLVGARGGQRGYGSGGLGGRVTATLTVSPGTTYLVYVGATSSSTAAGFNGGGLGYGVGAGGGGATDIRTTTSSAARLLVAGGGGGDGGSYNGTPYGNHGGAGGGVIALPGATKNESNSTYYGGGGGTNAAGGLRGSHGTACGGNGSVTNGGTACTSGGGGGGGGYYGGGGGYYSGGGGGASYATGSAVDVQHQQAYANATANGIAILSYRVSEPTTLSGATALVEPVYALRNGEGPEVLTTRPTCTTGYTQETAVAAPLANRSTSCSGASAANYTFTYASGVVTVERKEVVVQASSATVTYGDPIPTITAAYSGWVNDQGTEVLSPPATCTTAYVIGTSVATGATTSCADADAANYRFSYRAGTVTVNRKAAVITASDATVTYGDPVPTITPAYSGLVAGDTAGVVTTLPICSTVYTVSSDYGSAPATSCTGGAAANYTFSHEDGRVTILKREIIVQASSPIVAYGANVPTITATYTGWVNGQGPEVMGADAAICETTYLVTDGINVVPSTSCHDADALNYFFTYRSGTVTITRKNVDVTASDHVATYGDPSIAAPTPSYTGWVNGEGIEMLTTASTCTTTYTASSSVATGATTVCTGATADNYSFTAIQGRVTVERKELTVTASSPSVVYGAPTPTITPTYAGFVNDQNPSVVSNTTCSTAYTVLDVVGDTPATTCANATAANYSFRYIPGVVTIGKRQVTVVAESPTVYYGAAKPSISFTLLNMANGETDAVLATQPSCDTAYTSADLTTATPRTWCENADDENYFFVYTDGSVTILPAIITVTASSDTRVYGDPSVPTITPSFTGWVNDQDDSLLTTRPTCSTDYTNLTTVAADARTWCSGAVGGQYTFRYVDGLVDVTAKGVVVTASDETAVYGDLGVTVTPTYAGFVNGQTASQVVSGIVCASTFIPTSAVGTTPTTSCSGAVAANYSFTYESGTVTITQRALTVTAPDHTVTYGDATPDLTPAITGFVNAQNAGVLAVDPVCTTPHTPQTDVAAPVADRTITCDQAVAQNYRFTYETGEITILRKTLTMSGLVATDRTYDGERDIAIAGAPVLAGVESWDAVSAVGAPVGTADSRNAGSRLVTVSGVSPSAGDGENYTIQTLVLSATILERELTITGYGAVDRIYNRSATTAITGVGVLVGRVAGDVVSIAGSPVGTSTSRDVGTHSVTIDAGSISLAGTHAANYALTTPVLSVEISPKPLSVAGWSAPTRVYDGSDSVVLSGTPTLVGIIGPDVVTLDGVAVATASSKDIGSRAITITGVSLGGASSSNYSLALPSLSIAITARPLSLSGLAATDRTYDGSRAIVVTGTPALVGIVGSEDVVPSGSAIGTAATRNQGSQVVTVSGISLDGADRANYVLTTLTLSATIARKELTTTGYSAVTRQYTKATGFTISGAGSLVGVVGTDVVALTGTPVGTSTDGVDVGSHQVAVSGVTLTGAGASNYFLTLPTVPGVITRRNLAISGLTATGRAYDASRDIAITGTPALVGVYAGDVVALAGTPVGTADQASAGLRSVTVTGLSLTGASEPNYALPDPVLSATIARKSITIAGLSPTDRDYNRQTAVAVTGTPTLLGVEPGDVVTVTGAASGTATSRDSGNRSVAVTGFSLGGVSAANYTLVHPTLTVIIGQKPLTIAGLTAPTRAYNRSDAVSLSGVGTLVGIESGDSVTLSGSPSGLAASREVGTHTVAVSGLVLGGTAASNYRLTPLTVPVTITPKNLTVSGVTAPTRAYDGTTDVDLLGTPELVGVVIGDAVALTGNATGSIAAAGIGTRTVTVTGYAIGGDDAHNYTVSQPAPSVTISRAPVAVRASSPTVTYGDSVPGVVPSYSGFIDGEGEEVLTQTSTCVTDYTPTSGVGSAPATRCSGTTAANYSFSHLPGAVQIAQRPLQVTASSAVLEHGAPIPTVTPTYSGLVNGDPASVVTGQSCSTGYTTATPAGETRPTTCAGGLAANYAITYVAGTVTVVQSDVMIAWAAPADITYETPITTAQLNATVSDDYGPVGSKGTLVYSVGGRSLSEGDILGAGTHTLSVEFVPRAEEADNYGRAVRAVTLIIHKAPQSLVAGTSAPTRIYGESATLSAGSYSGTGDITYQVLSGPCRVVGANLTTTGAGTCSVRASIAADANYLPQTSAPITITVGRKTLVVTPIDVQRRRGSADPALTHLVTGFVGADLESDLDQAIQLVRDPGEDPGTYAIRASGGADADYDFDYRVGTFTIIERDVPALAWESPDPIVYGTALSPAELDPSASFGGAAVAGTWVFADAAGPVAVGTRLRAGSHVLTATFTPSNTVDFQSGVTRQTIVTVQRKPLVVIGVTAEDRLFDETTRADVDVSQAQLVGIVAPDAVDLVTEDAVGAFVDATVGEAKTVAFSGLTLDGADVDNYRLVQPTATATIEAAVPGPPTAVAASPADRSAVVEWAAPAFGGGAEITSYTVTAEPGGGTCVWSSGPLRCTVADLANGSTYTFTVRATNRAGTGSPSSPSSSISPATPMLAIIDSALEEGGDVAADGTVTLDIGCSQTAKTCNLTVQMYVGRDLVATGGTDLQAGTQRGIAMRLPPAYQERLARERVMVVRLVVEFEIDGSVVRLQSTMVLEAPSAPTLRRASLRPTSSGQTDFAALCRGARVERCDGVLSLYAQPLTVRPDRRAKAKRILLASGDFGAAAGAGVDARMRLTKSGRAFLRRHGAVRVVPVLTLKGKTRLRGAKLRPFAMTVMTPRQWLRRAIGTLTVGGRPRLDLNLLLDAHRAGRISDRAAADRIEKEIIPRRERALRRVEALPIPPRRMRAVLALLERSFDESLAANHAYIRWLRNGGGPDDIAWRRSAKATRTKQQLIEQLQRHGRRYGIEVPPATGLWP